MIWYSIIATGIAAFAIWAAWRFRKKAAIEKGRSINFAREVTRRDHIIKRLEEVNRETAKKKKKLNTGSDSDKFDASMDILSDLSGKSGSD